VLREFPQPFQAQLALRAALDRSQLFRATPELPGQAEKLAQPDNRLQAQLDRSQLFRERPEPQDQQENPVRGLTLKLLFGRQQPQTLQESLTAIINH
jgi:hypothetical protein